jgi:hypothetical protein
MAQQIYPMNMQDTIFPLLSEQQTRTIMGASIGQAPAEAVKPGVAYMHNVMPTKYGMSSVGYTEIAPNLAIPSAQPFVDVRVMFGDSAANVRTYIGFTADGKIYLLDRFSDTWVAVQAGLAGVAAGDFDKDKLSSATVNKVTYLFYAGVNIYRLLDISVPQIQAATATGLNIANVVGITSSYGYLVAVTKDAVAWSSTIDPLDFTPSQVTGAGGGVVANADGDILFATSNSLGILIYTLNNIVAATYTGNALYPFKFREVDGSKGGVTLSNVAWESNSAQQFVYSKAGLMSVTSKQADMFLPEISDFLSGQRFEDFNEVTKLLVQTELAIDTKLVKQIKYISSRYIVISYGLPSTPVLFTHALVIDTAMSKVGKLKIDHADVFEYTTASADGSKDLIAFLAGLGSTKIVNFSAVAANTGVIVMGKLQATLTRLLGLMGVEVENVNTGASLELLSSASFDGKNFTNVAGTLKDTASNVREYAFRSSALTHNIILIGQFNLVNLQVTYRIEGRR